MPGLSFYGVPGYLDMPSAWALPDGTFAFSANQFGSDVRRGSMAFQISPRLTGVFRYSYINHYSSYAFAEGGLYDRSFDLRLQLMTEDPRGWRPALTVGLQDFGGTGIFGAEYLVASRHFGPSVTASLGMGWGRFGSYGSFSNPLSVITDRFDNRGGFSGDIRDTGQIGFDRFFRGDAALFAGMDWQATERLRLSIEYSSDALESETSRMGYRHRTPINIGAQYRFDHGGTVGLALLYGSQAALSYSIPLDPSQPAFPSGHEPAPPAISPGTSETLASWGIDPDSSRRARLAAELDAQGLWLDDIRIQGDTAIVAVTSKRWGARAQAWGRTARVLSAELPQAVRQFRIRSMVQGMAVKDVTLSRSDLEELEFAPDSAWAAYARADIRDAASLPDPRLNLVATSSYLIMPYAEPAFFDPDDPLRLDVGAELYGEWSPFAGFHLSGALRQKIAGNLDESTRRSGSIQQHVRSDAPSYAKTTGPKIAWATADWFARPGEDLYSRVTFGLLEQMFGGLSTELLWAPIDRPYALGIEVNYAKQRDYDGEFGFFDYDIVTGHVSGYYDFGSGYNAQVDVGRYLAGDWGSTFTLTRRFGNGFEVGAFFTLTDISFDDYGEGSFDKGITITIPLSWVTGQATAQKGTQTIRPIQRDGGARLNVRNRLYGLIRDENEAAEGQRWGRFWR